METRHATVHATRSRNGNEPPTDFAAEAVKEVTESLRPLLADTAIATPEGQPKRVMSHRIQNPVAAKQAVGSDVDRFFRHYGLRRCARSISATAARTASQRTTSGRKLRFAPIYARIALRTAFFSNGTDVNMSVDLDVRHVIEDARRNVNDGGRNGVDPSRDAGGSTTRR
jgi:hypothetical protein